MKLDAVFELILEKPGMYIGRPSATLAFAFLQGYRTALKENGDDHSSLVLGDFQRWVQKRFSIEITLSWANIILFMAGGDESRAFELTKE